MVVDKLARAADVLRLAEIKAGLGRGAYSAERDLAAPAPKVGALGALDVDLSPGSVVGVAGSTALLLALVGSAGAGERWTAIVGMPDLGVTAATEFGVDLSRLVLIPNPGVHSPRVLAALVDGFDVVVVGEAVSLRPGQRRSLLGRARGKRTTLFTPPWPEAPVRVVADTPSWEGIGQGRGYLRRQRLVVRRSGRGGEWSVQVQLPAGAQEPPRGQELRRVG